MGLTIPSFGQAGFMTLEDRYEVNNKFSSYNERSNGQGFAICNPPSGVKIQCKNKQFEVNGFLSEPLTFQAHAEWTEMFGGGIMSTAGTAVETISNIIQYGKGWSIQQPWMNRKMYKTTKPLTFNLKLDFISTGDKYDNSCSGLEEVWKPCASLLSLVYPRLLSDKEHSDEFAKISEDGSLPSMLAEYKKKCAKSCENVGSLGIVGAMANAMNIFQIPGPSLMYGSNNGEAEGDVVSIMVGDYILFRACYVEDVKVELSPVMDSDGYPLWGKVTLTVTQMDSNYCRYNGDFLFSGFDDATSDLSRLIEEMKYHANKIAEATGELKDAVIGFWTGGKYGKDATKS